MNHVDKEYNRLLHTILDYGRVKKNRTGVDTIGVFGEQARFNFKDGFPILTTKKVWFKGIVHELLWFIQGNTNIKYLVDNDVHIWDDWAYARYKKSLMTPPFAFDEKNVIPQEKFIQLIKENFEFAKQWGELGEGTYGGMWRAFPTFKWSHTFAYNRYKNYLEDHPENTFEVNPTGDLGGNRWRSSWTEERFIEEVETDVNFATLWGKGELVTVDQLQKVINKLKTNPDDRRMIVSAWHPYWVDHCALPPCHCLFHFNTEELTQEERWNLISKYNWCEEKKCHKNQFRRNDATLDTDMDNIGVPRRKLNLLLYQRSCDTFLGVPFNISSYSLLLAMVAHVVGMVPDEFIHTYGDLHIYENHREQVNLQLSRCPKDLPKLWLNEEVKSLFDFRYEDIKLLGYDPHPAIKGEVAV